jgi:hypothetical protein
VDSNFNGEMQEFMETTLIMPMAGSSSRYPGVRPKWSLTHPTSGDMMFIDSIRHLNFDNIKKLVLIMRNDHLEQYKPGIIKQLSAAEKDLNIKTSEIVEIKPEDTNGPADTLALGIKALNIEGAICAKDCDFHGVVSLNPGNWIGVAELEKAGMLNAGNNSYVTTKNNIITNIAEKKVISNLFCTGFYGFEDAQQYLASYKKIKDNVPENSIFISHVIYQMLIDGIRFNTRIVDNYISWATAVEWHKYCSKYAVLFVDIDGVLVQRASKYTGNEWGNTKPITQNIQILNKARDNGAYIIITTSRSSSSSHVTETQLQQVGMCWDKIIYDLPASQRILINDFAPSAPYPSCSAINIPRDATNLDQYLAHYIS